MVVPGSAGVVVSDVLVPMLDVVGGSAKTGWEWVSDVHSGQLQRLADRGGRG